MLVAVSASGVYVDPNMLAHWDCVVCGNSFDTIREEISFTFLEQTLLEGETYQARLRHKKVFQAEMMAAHLY